MASLKVTATYNDAAKQLQFTTSYAPQSGLVYIPNLPEPTFIAGGSQNLEIDFILANDTKIDPSQFSVEMLGMAAWAVGDAPQPWIVLSPSGQYPPSEANPPLSWSTSLDATKLTLSAALSADPAAWTCWLAAQLTYVVEGKKQTQTIILDPKIYNEGGGQ